MTDIIAKGIEILTDCINNYFPTVSLGDGVMAHMLSAVSYLVDLIASLNWILPVNDILLILSLYFGYKFALFAVAVVNWVVRRIFDVIP